MEREEVLTLLDIQRKYFYDAIDRVHRQLTDTVKDYDKKLSDVITSLEYSLSSLDETTAKFHL